MLATQTGGGQEGDEVRRGKMTLSVAAERDFCVRRCGSSPNDRHQSDFNTSMRSTTPCGEMTEKRDVIQDSALARLDKYPPSPCISDDRRPKPPFSKPRDMKAQVKSEVGPVTASMHRRNS